MHLRFYFFLRVLQETLHLQGCRSSYCVVRACVASVASRNQPDLTGIGQFGAGRHAEREAWRFDAR